MNDIRHDGYDAVDRILFVLGRGNNECLSWVEPGIQNKPYYDFVWEILNKYSLVKNKGANKEDITGIMSLTGEGFRALESGGIREYIIDHDPEYFLEDGYAKMYIVYTTTGDTELILRKFLIRNNMDELDLHEYYNSSKYRIDERLSRRVKSKSMTPQPTTVTNYNFPGNSGTIYSGSLENNQGNITLATNQEAKDKKHSLIERGSWVAGIFVGAVVLFEAYLHYIKPLFH